MNDSVSWISVDIETSGLDPLVHETIEVGLCWHNGKTHAFSLPFDESKASERALEVNGWGKRAFAPLLAVGEGMRIMYEAFEDGSLVVASPAHFDLGFLEAIFRKEGARPPWSHRAVIDIKTYACAKWGVLTELKNSTIAKVVGLEELPEGQQHSALNDAMWQAELFRRLL